MKKYISLSLLSLLFSCGNPVKTIKNEIKKFGYILYQTPLKSAGTGTIIGGAPDAMSWITNPDTCFPNEIDGHDLGIRYIEDSELPAQYRSFETSNSANADLIKFLQASTGAIGMGVQFDLVKEMSLEFSGVKIEYLDSVQLKHFYDNYMDEVCKDFLDKTGFIIQALKVDQMSFRFYSAAGVGISLNGQVVQEILELDTNLEFAVENEYTLNITSPMYIGFQLGRLRRKDGGLSLHRSTKVKKNKYIFSNLNIFDSMVE